MYTKYQAIFPVVRMGPPAPHPLGSVHPPPGKGGGTRSLAGKGVRGPNCDEGTDTLVLYVYYNPSAEGGILKDLRLPNYKALTGGPGTLCSNKLEPGASVPNLVNLAG